MIERGIDDEVDVTRGAVRDIARWIEAFRRV
jgi:hypothetical protein